MGDYLGRDVTGASWFRGPGSTFIRKLDGRDVNVPAGGLPGFRGGTVPAPDGSLWYHMLDGSGSSIWRMSPDELDTGPRAPSAFIPDRVGCSVR